MSQARRIPELEIPDLLAFAAIAKLEARSDSAWSKVADAVDAYSVDAAHLSRARVLAGRMVRGLTHPCLRGCRDLQHFHASEKEHAELEEAAMTLVNIRRGTRGGPAAIREALLLARSSDEELLKKERLLLARSDDGDVAKQRWKRRARELRRERHRRTLERVAAVLVPRFSEEELQLAAKWAAFAFSISATEDDARKLVRAALRRHGTLPQQQPRSTASNELTLGELEYADEVHKLVESAVENAFAENYLDDTESGLSVEFDEEGGRETQRVKLKF